MENNGKIGCSNSKVKIVDPNDFNGMNSSDNVSVPLEDLNISVVLRTKRKGRTILSSDGESDTIESNGTVEINFIEGTEINGKKSLTTKFTDLTTVYDSSFNDETLGISSIDIDFNPSMAPMITINFIDVRGSSIFQNEKNISGNNNTNKYATFFQLPYPLFELEIKGYYGLPVTYCLHMLKFTTKFNSKTGNFEIQCQFIGYTYAMLSDMLIGYLRAIKETTIGAEIYKSKNDARKAKGGNEIIGLLELSQYINKINQGVKKVGSESDAAKAINTLEEGNESLDKIKSHLDSLGSGLDIEQSSENKDDYTFIITKDIKNSENIINLYLNNIEASIKEFNNKNTGYNINISVFKDLTSPGTDKGFFTNLSTEKITNDIVTKQLLSGSIGSEEGFFKFKDEILIYLNKFYPELKKEFDVYNLTSLYNEIDKARVAIENNTKKAKESLAIELKSLVRESLGFEPTVRNITEIFTFAAEVFMETIFRVSTNAKNQSVRTIELDKKFKTNSLDNSDLKVNAIESKLFHPWPDYKEKDESTNTFIEKYLGSSGVLENPKNVAELTFVDDLLKAFLISKNKLDAIDSSAEETPTWYPINPIDTNIYNSKEPYKRINITNQIDLLTTCVIRGMTFLGFTNDEKHLSKDEIINMANIEADNILNGITNKSLLQSLTQLTLKSFSDASNIINGENTKIVTNNGNRYYYSYIFNDEKIVKGIKSVLILPINDNFSGNWSKDFNDRRLKSRKNSVFIGNGYRKDKNNRVSDDGSVFIKILTPDEYKTDVSLMATDKEISNDSVLKLNDLKSDEISNAKSAGFNSFGGPLGIQDFSKMDFGNKDLDGLPLRFMFFNDKHKGGGLALTRKATLKSNLTTESDVKNSGMIFLNTKGSIFTTDDGKTYLHGQISKNNRLFFNKLLNNSKDITYPYIYMPIDAKPNGDDSSVSYGDRYENTNINGKMSLFGSKFYYYQDTAKINTKENGLFSTKDYSRALLFLNSLPWIGNGFGVDGDIFTNPDMINEVIHLFDVKAGFVHVPKLWCAYVGGILWRLDSTEPIIQNNRIVGGGSTHSDPIVWKYRFNSETKKYMYFKVPTKSQYFPSFNIYREYYQDISSSDVIKNMPVQVANEFKKVFFQFVNGNGPGISWENLSSKLEIFDGHSSIFEKFIDDNSVLDKTTEPKGFYASRLNILKNKDNYSKILFNYEDDYLKKTNIFLELKDDGLAVKTLINSLLEESIILNTSFKIWKGDGISGGSLISVSEENFKDYFETILKKIVSKADSYSPSEEKKSDELDVFGTSNEDTIKLILYKNCKNIYDKWLAGVDNPNKIIFQCGNNTRNDSDKEIGLKYGNETPSLIDSFRFVSRSFKDIGDKLFINPLPINDYLTNDQNTSLYDAVTSILTSNKFTFEALPTFINFRDDKNVKSIFTPYGNYGEVLKQGSCGPSFVCTYAGQPSKHLDFKDSEYANDGFDMNCINGDVNPNIPDDFKNIEPKLVVPNGFNNQDVIDKESNSEINGVNTKLSGPEDPVAVFLVRYGQQNQNIFKDIELDQSEFTETDESLQIQDEISQKGAETNKTIAGQNIYNVYSVRSYTAKVEMMGNAMIQPMMYFQLDNIPMFHGAYMVTRVQHSITPNNMKTTFSGVRTRFSETPLLTAYDLYMSFADTLDTSNAGVGSGTFTHGSSNQGGFVTYQVTENEGLKYQEKGPPPAKGDNWAQKEVGQFMQALAIMWHQANKDKTNGDTLYINSFGAYGGGGHKEHSTNSLHYSGRAVDLSPMTKTKENIKHNVGDTNYSEIKNIELIQMALDLEKTNKYGVRINNIILNDSNIIKHFNNIKNSENGNLVISSKGHANHLHIEFDTPDRVVKLIDEGKTSDGEIVTNGVVGSLSKYKGKYPSDADIKSALGKI